MARELVGYLVLEDEAVEAGDIEPHEGSYWETRERAKVARHEAGKGWSVYELSRRVKDGD